MKIKMLGDRILVARLDSETKTAGGIIIPDSAKEKPLEGIVRTVGDGKKDSEGKHEALAVKEGDKVLFGKYSGTEIKFQGETLLILREDEILAIIGD